MTWWSYVFNSYSNLELLSIGKVVYYESSEQLILRPKANRFCSNVKRQDKRNGIYFVINIPEFNFTQKCHDHTCAGYQSESFTLDPALFIVRFKRKHRFCKDYNASKKRKISKFLSQQLLIYISLYSILITQNGMFIFTKFNWIVFYEYSELYF